MITHMIASNKNIFQKSLPKVLCKGYRDKMQINSAVIFSSSSEENGTSVTKNALQLCRIFCEKISVNKK